MRVVGAFAAEGEVTDTSSQTVGTDQGLGGVGTNTENDRVIYQQRYETFRHLDRLRWQSPTIVLAGGTAFLGLAKADARPFPPSWAVLVFAVLSFLSAFMIYRVRRGIRENRVVLDRVAWRLGDQGIPDSASGRGASHSFQFFLALLGVASVALAVFLWSSGY